MRGCTLKILANMKIPSAIDPGNHDIIESDSRVGPSKRRQPSRWACISGLFVGLWAVILCWEGVSWAFRARPILSQDELANLEWAVRVSYGRILHILPAVIYNDRPMGFALQRFLFDRFGFNYTPQLVCFLAIHFANCAMAFVMFRRLGVRILFAAVGVGVLGTLTATMQTATYLGSSFDVLCTFFLLGSTLAILSERKWLWLLSALLYLLALRSKEFGIVIPLFLTALLAIRAASGVSSSRILLSIGKRLWLHYAILLAFGLRYLWLARDMRAKVPAGASYYMDFSVMVPLKSYMYYTGLVFGADDRYCSIACTAMAIILGYAVVRRRFMILFGFCVYLLTLLPVSLLPNIRQPFYVYGPQIFLILAVTLFLQDVLDSTFRESPLRWRAGVCVAIVTLTAASAFRESEYVRDRIHFSWMVRNACGTSAASMQKRLADIGLSSHIYINNGQETPWLFAYGDCTYPRMLHRSESIQCILQKPEPELLRLYWQDSSEKYFVDYAADGVLNVRLRAPAAQVP
jgi:hypothetical protein